MPAMLATRRTRGRVCAAATAVYLFAVSAAFLTGIPSALCVTPLFFAVATWAFGPRVGLPAVVATEVVSFTFLASLPPGRLPSPYLLIAAIIPTDLLIFGVVFVLRQTEFKRVAVEAELRKQNAELEATLAEVKELRGMLPICAWCKCVRDMNGMWNKLEAYLAKHSRATFTHGICPQCVAQVTEEEQRAAATVSCREYDNRDSARLCD